MEKKKKLSTPERIWEAYKMYVSSSFVNRIGFQRFGLAQDFSDSYFSSKKDMFYERGQSSGEHQANTALLFNLFASNYPSFLRQRTMASLNSVNKAWIMTMILLIHDVGEIKGGDVPDNGDRDDLLANSEELEVLQEFVCIGFDKKDAEPLIEGIKGFQNDRGHYNDALKALDKLGFLLDLVYDEKYGFSGNTMHAKDVSELDAFTVKFSGTNNPVDNVAVHVRMQYKEWDIPDYITAPIYAVLEAAVRDARNGEFYSWWDKEVPSLSEFEEMRKSPH